MNTSIPIKDEKYQPGSVEKLIDPWKELFTPEYAGKWVKLGFDITRAGLETAIDLYRVAKTGKRFIEGLAKKL
jgi:hypothetical protein